MNHPEFLALTVIVAIGPFIQVMGLLGLNTEIRMYNVHLRTHEGVLATISILRVFSRGAGIGKKYTG